LAAKWLLHKAKPKGKNLEDFDALLERHQAGEHGL
jgi:hypothetical protein